MCVILVASGVVSLQVGAALRRVIFSVSGASEIGSRFGNKYIYRSKYRFLSIVIWSYSKDHCIDIKYTIIPMKQYVARTSVALIICEML